MKKGFIVFGISCIFFGVFSLLIGISQDISYNENSIDCVAVITNIDTSNPAASEGINYHHTYYGKYTVNGKMYKDIKILFESTGSKTPNYSVGQAITITVDVNNPTKLSEKGVAAYIIFAVMIVSGAFFMMLSRLINKK